MAEHELGADKDAAIETHDARKTDPAGDADEGDGGRVSERERERALLAEHGVDLDDPQLDQAIRQLEAGATDHLPYGQPGKPLGTRSPLLRAMQASVGVVLVGVVGYIAYAVRDILVAVLVALFLATGLSPAVEWLRRVGLPHAIALIAVVLTVVGIVVGTVLAGLPPLIRQGNDLAEQLPQYVREVVDNNPTLLDLDQRIGIVRRVEDVASGEGSDVLDEQSPRVLLGVAMGVVQTVVAVSVTLVLALYFLANFRGIKRAAYRLVPRSRRARVTLLADAMLDRIGMYVLGNIATSMVAGVAAGTVLWALDVPYAAALGLFVALTDLIPLVGATIGAVVSTAIAFTVGPGTGIVCIGFFVVYQQFENFVLVPRVMRRAVDVSPAATIVAVLIGGALLGIVGALLAVPIAAAVQLVATEVIMPRQEGA